MKRILIAAVLMGLAGGAYAADFAGLLTLKVSDLKGYDVRPVMPGKAALAQAEGLNSLYLLLINDDFSDPSDKKLVEAEIHRILKIGTNRGELIASRVTLGNAIVEMTEEIRLTKVTIELNCRNLRNGFEDDFGHFAGKTDAEIVETLMHGNYGHYPPSPTVKAIRSDAEKLERLEPLKVLLVSERVLVAARLAELN